MTRRGLYQGAIFVLGGIVGAGLSIPAAAYLLLGPKKEGADGWADAGSLGSLPEGKPTRLIVERERQDAWNRETEKLVVWAVRGSDDKVTAYSSKCPHLGCGVSWNGETGQFDCPCHDSSFSQDGAVLGGPSARGLDHYETRIEGDRLWLGPVREGDAA